MDVRTLSAVANLLSVARRVTRAQAGTVYSRETDGLRFLVSQNEPLARDLGYAGASDTLTRTHLPWTERSIATYVALTSSIVNIPDVYALPATAPYAFSPRVDATTGFRTQSMLALPLDTPIRGVLQLINATDAYGGVVPFSEAAERLVSELAADPTVPAFSAIATANHVIRA